MRKLLFPLTIIYSTFCHSQNDKIYATKIGMKNDQPFQDSVKFHLKEQGNGFLILNWIEIVESGKKFKDLYKVWGIKYNDDYYFHLSNARGLNALKSFIKIDTTYLSKKYLPFVINCKAPINKPTTTKNAGVAIGSVAIGMLVGSEAGFIFMITTKDKNSPEYWKKKDNVGAYLYIVEMNSSLAPIAKRINRKRLKKLLVKNNNKQKYDFEKMKLEEAISLIKLLN